MFEGEINNRVPKKDFGLQMEFEIAGMLLGHSILQDGPSMACLSDSIYQYLVSENADLCFPSKSDIPLNLATHHLITFIEQVHACLSIYVVVVRSSKFCSGSYVLVIKSEEEPTSGCQPHKGLSLLVWMYSTPFLPCPLN